MLSMFTGASEKGNTGLTMTTSSGWVVLCLSPLGGAKPVSFLEPREASFSLCSIWNNVFCKSSGMFIFIFRSVDPTGRAKTMFVAGISWRTSTQLPWENGVGWGYLSYFCFLLGLARASLCRADLGRARHTSGKARRAVLKEKDRVNLKGCLCGALGVGLKAHNQD